MDLPDPTLWERLQSQAPEDIPLSEIQAAYEEQKGNEVDTLCVLWRKKTPSLKAVVPSKPVDPIQARMSEIRDICNAYEESMAEMFKEYKEKRLSQGSKAILRTQDDCIQ